MFRLDPATHRFLADSVLSELAGPEPVTDGAARCLRVTSNGGHAGRIYVISLSCWEGGQLRPAYRVQQDWDESARLYVRRSWARASGADTLGLVRTDTVPDSLSGG